MATVNQNAVLLTVNSAGGVVALPEGTAGQVLKHDGNGWVAAADENTTYTAASTTAAGLMSSADKVKLNGVATGATANSTDSVLKDRANHTGTQAISTVSGLQTALDTLTQNFNDLATRVTALETPAG